LRKQPRRTLDLIGFDADDTLWHSEGQYRGAEEKFKRLVAAYGVASVEPTMHEVEIRNLQYYGYGLKGFVMSLIESAIVLTQGRISAGDIGTMLDWAKEMQTAPVDLFEHARETVAALARDYPLVLVTKGDLLDQEAKLARSGLKPYFRYVEVVSEKTQESYAAILAHYRIAPKRFLMVGNSLKSDILPVIALGGYGVHIPAHLLWEHEAAQPPEDRQRYSEIEHLGLLLPLVESLRTRSR
jgi:putative hydrolase of the HAD superfamily